MTAYITVLRPTLISASMLKSTTAIETVPLYDPTATYAEGAKCRSDTTHRIYESKKAGNVGHDPTLPENQTGTTAWWQDIDPSNIWAMFDNDVSTQTVAASPFTVVLTPGFFSSAQFFGLDADHISVTVKDRPGGNVIREVAHELEGSQPADWDEYFWDPFEPETSFVVGDIDQYNKAEIAVTLTRTGGGDVRCGAMVVGDELALARTLTKPSVQPRSFTTVTTNKFGKTSFTRRRATSDLEMTGLLELEEANTVLTALQKLIDVPCAYKGSDAAHYSGLRCFGVGNGKLTYDEVNGKCLLNLTVQGIIEWQ